MLSCTYYRDGSLKSLTDMSGKSLLYGYDGEGRLACLKEDTGDILTEYRYTATGRIKEIITQSGIRTSYAYDGDVTEGYRYNERNELTEKISGGSLTCYRYDKNGGILSEEQKGRKSEYRYDLLNRQTYVGTLNGKEQEILSECVGDHVPVR